MHITAAAESAESMRALLARFQELAGPGKGVPLILAALARLGTTSCDWIDGELRIVVTGDDTQTTVSVSSSIGGGFAEKVLPTTKFATPFKEWTRAVTVAPKLLEPLHVQMTDKSIVLTASQEIRKTSLPPPAIEIDTKSILAVPIILALDDPGKMEPEDRPPARRAAIPAPIPGSAPGVTIRRKEPPK